MAAQRTWTARIATPFGRVVGAVTSWLLFALCFTLLLLSAWTVMGLGGYCASGGPYAIEVECPDAVAVFMPLSIFGGLAAVGVALAVARGFGMPLVAWAWPILFCGLGAAFLASYAQAPQAVSWLVIGIMFEVMGAVPLVWALRADARALLLGAVSIEGDAFAPRSAQDGGARSPSGTRWLTGARRVDDAREPRAPRGRDWMLALVPTIAAALLGAYAGVQLFHAAS